MSDLFFVGIILVLYALTHGLVIALSRLGSIQ